MRGLSSRRAVAAPFFVSFSFVARFVQKLFLFSIKFWYNILEVSE